MATHVQFQAWDTGKRLSDCTPGTALRAMVYLEDRGDRPGLYMVQEIVTAHEGQITVESVQRQGTTFTLPLRRAEGGGHRLKMRELSERLWTIQGRAVPMVH
jgi:K+-sensing histidine kinase KdpD